MSKLLRSNRILLATLVAILLTAASCVPDSPEPPTAVVSVDPSGNPGFDVTCDQECSDTQTEITQADSAICEGQEPLIMANSWLVLWEVLQNNPLDPDLNVDTDRIGSWVAITALDPPSAAGLNTYLAGIGGIASGVVLPNAVLAFDQGGFNYRPGQAPFEATSSSPPPLQMPPPAGTTRPVVVLDTGTVGATSTAVHFANAGSTSASDVDGISDDYTGHGPVIADLVGDLLGKADTDQDRSDIYLQRVLTERSAIGGPISYSQNQFRAFDTTAVMATLNDMTDNGNLSLNGAVINMSFSAPGCAELFPTNHPIAEWITENEVIAVASAGNDAVSTSNYPASWAGTNLAVISVGGADTPSSSTLTTACWTNTHPSITTYAAGNVRIDHPTVGDATWLGTSFAAPQVTAWVAANTAAMPLTAIADAVRSASGSLVFDPQPSPNPDGTC